MRKLHELAFILLALLATGLLAWLSIRWQVRSDWTHGQRASLSSQTQNVLARLPGPVEVESFAREAGDLRATVAAFVARYQYLKPDLSLRFIDPDRDPGAMRAQGVTLDGELRLRYGDRSQRVTQLNEREFTLALLKLTRPQARVVAFLAGHGERKPLGEANADWGRFMQRLREEDVRAVALNLGEQPVIPPSIDLLVIAAPQLALAPGEVARVAQWLDEGGALWLLAEPGASDWLAPLQDRLGVAPLAGTVVDATGQGLGVGNPAFVVLTHYPAHPALQDFSLTTLFPQSLAFAQAGQPAFAAQPLLRSSARSWTETGAISDTIAYDAGSREIPGPHDLALALTRLSPRPDRSEQRVVVMGDADFLSNAYLGNAGNQALGTRLMRWLVADDALIELAPVQAPDQDLVLSDNQLAVIGIGFLGILPLLWLATGLIVVWRRRRG